MDLEWNDNQPIYRQLRDRVAAMLLDAVLKEGEPSALGTHGCGGVPRQPPHRPQGLSGTG